MEFWICNNIMPHETFALPNATALFDKFENDFLFFCEQNSNFLMHAESKRVKRKFSLQKQTLQRNLKFKPNKAMSVEKFNVR